MSPTARPIGPLASLLIALVAVACAGKAPATTEPTTGPTVAPTGRAPAAAATAPADAAPDAWLVVGHAGDVGLQVILASTSERLFGLPTGVPDPTWSQLVTASASGTTTVVRDLKIPELEGPSQTIEGAWRLPTIGADPTPLGVSNDRGTIVLVEDGVKPTSAATATTRFAIMDRGLGIKPRIMELKGAFEYDTLSPNGSTLFVVEHLAGPLDGHYQVRAVDTATSTLRDGVVVDKSVSDEAMAGWPITQARQRDGMVYTLYHGAEHPFIHALSSIDSWALCIDLPATAGDAAAASDWGLAVIANDHSLVAANATLGLAVEVAISDLAVRRSVTFAPLASTGITFAKFGHQAGGEVGRRLVASPRGNVLYAAGPGGIVSIGTADLAVTGRLLQGVAVDAMAVTPDGRTIYALVHAGGRIVKLDIATGKTLGEVPGSGYDRLLAVVPW